MINSPLADGAGDEKLGIEGADAEVASESGEGAAIFLANEAGVDAVVGLA